MEKELKRIYRKHKKILVPGVLLFATFFITVRIIMPQIEAISEIRENIDVKNNEIEDSNKLFNTLVSMSDDELNRNYEIAAKAVPVQKDLALIFTSLTKAADETSVDLGGFTLNAGGVYDSTNQYRGDKTIDGVFYLNIVVNVSGNEENLIQFGEKLYEGIPLIQINSIQIRNGQGSFDVDFFFKPVAKQNAMKKKENVGSLTSKEKALLKKLSDWE